MKKQGMRKSKNRGSVFKIKDNAQSGDVKHISADSEQYDLGRVRYKGVGSKGYPAKAWDYTY